MEKVIDHFKKADPVIYCLGKKFSLTELEKSNDYFADLCEIIIGQQLSEKASATLVRRFRYLLPDKKILPASVCKLTEASIRSAGISRSKAQFLLNLATEILSGRLNLDLLTTKTDAEVISFLTKLRGIGPWSAEMFLMFSLARADVFSYGDLGLNNAIRKVYRLKKPPIQKKLDTIVRKWSPYRTYACLLLWKSLTLNDRELNQL